MRAHAVIAAAAVLRCPLYHILITIFKESCQLLSISNLDSLLVFIRVHRTFILHEIWVERGERVYMCALLFFSSSYFNNAIFTRIISFDSLTANVHGGCNALLHYVSHIVRTTLRMENERKKKIVNLYTWLVKVHWSYKTLYLIDVIFVCNSISVNSWTKLKTNWMRSKMRMRCCSDEDAKQKKETENVSGWRSDFVFLLLGNPLEMCGLNYDWARRMNDKRTKQHWRTSLLLQRLLSMNTIENKIDCYNLN